MGNNLAYPGGLDSLMAHNDLAAQPRLAWETVDIGAYEYQGLPAPRLIGPEDGTYRIGDELHFSVNFFKPIDVSGSPSITLIIGGEERTAPFTGITDDDFGALFSYTVVEGDDGADGIGAGAEIILNDGSIVFEDETELSLSICLPSLSGVIVDGVRPTFETVSVASDNEAPAWAKVGDKVTLTLQASEAIEKPVVTIAGHPVTVRAIGRNGVRWRAEYTMTVDDEEGPVDFFISDLVDEAGNEATDVTATTDESGVTFDKTAPLVDGVEDDAIYNVDVSPAFSEDEGATLNGDPYTSDTPITTDGDYELVVTDMAGNETRITFTVDKTAPVVTGVDDGGAYNKDVAPTFNEGEALLNGEPFVSGGTVSAEGGYKLTVTDAAGNKTTFGFTVDKTAPVVTDTEDGGLYNQDVAPVFNEGEGLLNGNPFTSGGTVAADGDYELVVTDAAGNEARVIFAIDQTAPVVTGVEDGGTYNKDVIPAFNEGEALLNDVTFTKGTTVAGEGVYMLVVTDAAGNKTTVGFTIDKTAPVITKVEDSMLYNQDVAPVFNEGEGLLNGNPFTSGGTVAVDGDYELVVTDAAGNETHITFTVDQTAPVVTGVEEGVAYSKEVVPVFNEGVATLNGGLYTSGTTVTDEGVHVLVVTDAAGNKTTISFVIDKTAPVVTGVEDGMIYNQNVALAFNEGEALLNDNPFASGGTVAADGDYELVVTDAAGNETLIKFAVDQTAPIVTGVENGKVYDEGVVLVFNEGAATLNGEPYISGTLVIAPGEYQLVVTDAAGNETHVRFTMGSLPGMPVGLSATVGDRQVGLNWQAPQGGGLPITGYVIEYSVGSGQAWTRAANAPSVGTQAVVIGLENNRPYRFRVAAENAVGTGAFGAELTGIIPTEPVSMPGTGGGFPEPAPGIPVVITDGKVETVTLEVVDNEYLRLSGDGYAMELASLGIDGERIPISSIDAVIRLIRGAGAQVYVSGHGFEPGTVVTVYLFSAPELVGHIPVGMDGRFAGTLLVPVHLKLGRHTLQANGVVAGGGQRSVSVGLLLVENRPQEIKFEALADRTYGDGPVPLPATATSGLPVSYAVMDSDGNAAGIASITDNNKLHIHGAGDIRITASQPGDVEYAAAVPVSRTLRIAKAPLEVSATDATRAYGEANPAFGLTYSGFVNGDDASALAVQPAAATDATETSAPGSYAINISGGQSANYAFTYHPAVLTVTKAQQGITFTAPAEVDCGTGSITLDVSSSSGLPVTLTVDDPQVATVNGSTLAIHRLGTVTITATQAGDGNYGAAEPVTVTIRVTDPSSDFPIRVHRAVSPNGDGINEFLMAEGIRDYPENRVTVINRNGTVLWEAPGYDNDRIAFRGISTGQQQLPAGTYFYIVEVKVNGKWEYEKGYFVLRY